MPAKKVASAKPSAAASAVKKSPTKAVEVKKEKKRNGRSASPAVSRSASPAPRPAKTTRKKAVAESAAVVAEPEVIKPVKVAKVSKKTSKTETIVKEKSSSKSKPCKLVNAYLMAYNAVSAGAWAYLLFNLCRSFFVDEPQNYRILFPKTGMFLAYLQTAALLEILHAAFGFVRSDVLTNVIQIASRLFIIWVCAVYYGVGKHWGYALLAFAWSLSDLTRYCYYFSQLAGWRAPLLKWARYNFFLVLYPVGTLGEMMLVLWARQMSVKQPHIYWPFLAVIAAYAPGFLTMYEQMLKQRSKQAEKDSSKQE